MTLLHKTLAAASLICLISCSLSNDEPLNAITNLKMFSHAEAQAKYGKVVEINKEDLYGEWTIISSFFTIRSIQSVTTFGLEGQRYTIREDGTYIMDNSSVDEGPSKGRWKLKSNNTVFDNGSESWHVRIKGDTMEWIEQIDDDYSYFVLAK